MEVDVVADLAPHEDPLDAALVTDRRSSTPPPPPPPPRTLEQASKNQETSMEM
jgi:hypothetical protein